MTYTKNDAYMQTAKTFARLSKAKRLKVGSVLVDDGRVISCGYNGCVSGGSNECEFEVGGELITKPEVIHAEANVILFAAKRGIPTDGCDLYTTHSPCYECSKMIAQSGIRSVYYEEDYRDDTGIRFLRNNGINVSKEGY